jgi:hypothetical protein
MACQSTTASMFYPRADWDDPVMGEAPSCSLISALASVAWVYWPIIKDSLSPTFFKLNENGDASGTLPALAVEKRFEMDPAGIFKNAHSSDAGIWPAVYEKAYMKDLKNGASGDVYYCDVGKDEFDLSWPLKTGGLVALTGWGKVGYYTVTDHDPYIKIKGLCESNKQRIKYPMIGWTITKTNWPDVYQDTKPVSETNRCPGFNQMIPDHCYSILGYIPDQYIVLRCPRARVEVFQGFQETQPVPHSGSGHLVADGTLLYPKGPMTSYNKGGVPSVSRTVESNITLNINKGVFAIRKDQFQRYFEGYGYIK